MARSAALRLDQFARPKLHAVVDVRVARGPSIRRVCPRGVSTRERSTDDFKGVTRALVAPLIHQRERHERTPPWVIGHQKGGKQSDVRGANQDSCVRCV